MAELLERRLLHLKARLDDLRRSYAQKERPLEVDLQIQLIEDQLAELDGFGSQGENLH